MKFKLISIILAFSMIFGTFSAFAQESTIVITDRYNYTHDSKAVGAAPDSGVTNGNTIKVVDWPSSQNKSLFFSISNNNTAFINGAVATSEPVVFEFDICFESLAHNGSVSLNAMSTSGQSCTLVNFDSLGNLYASPDDIMLKRIGISDKFTKVSIALDIRTGAISVYVNERKLTGKINTKIATWADVKEFRMNVRGQGTKLYVDNFCCYTAEEPRFAYADKGMKVSKTGTLSEAGTVASDEELRAYMGDAVAFYPQRNKYYKDGSLNTYKSNIMKLENCKAYILGDFATEVLGLSSDGNEYIEASVLAEKLGKKLYLDDGGVMVISEKDDFFELGYDLPMYTALVQKLSFMTESATDMFAKFKRMYSANEHPRLYGNSADFQNIIDLAETDDVMKAMKANVISDADTELTKPTITLSTTEPLDTARGIVSRVHNLGMAYRLTGDTRYAAKLWEHMEAVCGFENWDHEHFLSTGEYMYGMALGYDWIYDYLTEEQRKLVRDNLISKGLNHALEDYEDVPTRVRSNKWAQLNIGSNWLVVVNTGVIAASLVTMETNEELSAKLIDYAMESIKNAIVAFAPDGAWHEGTTYWLYTVQYYGYFINILNGAFGTDYGYMDIPGVDKTVDFMLGVQGNNGTFNYGDSNHTPIVAEQFLLFSNKFRRADIQNYYLENSSIRSFVTAFNYDPTLSVDAAMSIPLDNYVRNTEVATMHNSFGKNSIFTAIHSGKVGMAHGQFDSGEFVIDAYGTDFLIDLGSASYSLRPQEYLYRRRAEGHNLFVINPDYFPGQNINAFTRITRFENDATSAIAVTDLTEAYNRDALSAVRAIKMTDNRNSIILQDELILKEKSELYWFFHTKCPISISEDGKTAIFEGKYKNMRATLVDDINAKFELMQAVPLPNVSPKVTNDIDDSKVNKLYIHATDVDKANLSIKFTFEFPDETIETKHSILPIKDWTLDGGELPVLSKLTDLKVDGKTISGFDPDNLMYVYQYSVDNNVPEITADGENVSISYPKDGNGNAYIYTGDAANKNIYVVKLVKKQLKTLESGAKELFVYGAEESVLEQEGYGAENTIDGSIEGESRYSAQGKPYITYDMGTRVKLTDYGLAVWQGAANDGRQQNFEVYVSEDGHHYTKVYTGLTSGTTLEMEYFHIRKSAIGRYIRVQFTGATKSAWNSPTECAFFGQEVN